MGAISASPAPVSQSRLGSLHCVQRARLRAWRRTKTTTTFFVKFLMRGGLFLRPEVVLALVDRRIVKKSVWPGSEPPTGHLGKGARKFVVIVVSVGPSAEPQPGFGRGLMRLRRQSARARSRDAPGRAPSAGIEPLGSRLAQGTKPTSNSIVWRLRRQPQRRRRSQRIRIDGYDGGPYGFEPRTAEIDRSHAASHGHIGVC